MDFLISIWATSSIEEKILKKETEELKALLRNLSGFFQIAERSHSASLVYLELLKEYPDDVYFALSKGVAVGKSIAPRKNASKRHAPTRAARKFVIDEWKLHRSAYDGNKSAFTRDYVKRVRNEFDVVVTEKQMREVWLKDTPSASKPDGLPAGG